MTWSAKFEVVFEVSLLAERQRLDAHLAAIEAGTAAPPELESLDAHAREPWRIALVHGELLAFLGLRARADDITLVCLSQGSGVAMHDGDRPLALGGRSEQFDDRELLELLGRRELLLVGSPEQLRGLAELFERHAITPTTLAVIVDHAPMLPAAARLLQDTFSAPVGEGLRDDEGGWLAIARKRGELLVQVRAHEQLCVISPAGDLLGRGQAGLLGTRRGSGLTVMRVCGCLQTTRDGRAAVELLVPPSPLGSSIRPELTAADLHDILGTLPVFGYHLRFDDVGGHLELSIVPGLDRTRTEKAILDAISPGTDALTVVFAAPGTEFPRERVFDERGIYRGRVCVVWAGEPGSDTRRAGWRQALTTAGSGRARLSLVDSRAIPTIDDVAGILSELKRERAGFPSLFGSDDTDVRIAVGDPNGDPGPGSKPHGWISLLPADDEREAMFIAGAERLEVAAVQSLLEAGVVLDALAGLSVDGLSLHAYSRPLLGRGRDHAADRRPLWLDESRCVGSGDCVRICPTQAITLQGEPARPVIDEAACINCHLCAERCEVLALRPIVHEDAALPGPKLAPEAARLHGIRARKRPRALVGKLAEPPSGLAAGLAASSAAALDRRAPAVISRKPTVVLGLATVTLMEHTAALLVDGKLVSAIEEERLVRERHYTWKHPERPGTSLSSDICLRLEEAFPPRAIDAVLRTANLTMADVDIVAVNGIPARFRKSFVGGGGWRPPPVLRANSVVFVPHHMSHAACVYGLSDYDDAWILSIDGRGDYETATVWRAEGHELEVIDAVPWLPDCSFGGVYETATRVLGFGTHGQGSTMALAALGEPTVDLSECMSLADDHRPVLSEWAAEKLMAPYTRGRDQELTDEHRNLAASMQRALETTVGDYLAHHAGDLRGHNLALCGGVALNCRMNGILRDRFEPRDMLVPPGANDAGTAIGAAFIGHRELTGELPRLDLGHTHVGPEWSDDAIVKALERMRVPFQRLRDVADQTAELIAAGKIVCWFQGPMEFGPRALGGRSILADPRREDLKPRLNEMKSREPWRPFGPSVLAGRQSDWFVQGWDSRYMLFAVDVRPEKREQIPVVVHYDGTSRPQVVHAEHHPRYHAMISAFERRTNVPMVVNTSFNRGGEPIVCNPAEALRSFSGLGADAIVLGNCLVRRDLLRRR
jgi:predicted NodU family carbamoyl transferase/NAD-dependent dihydropyrimidine dehydrogenase PreA subunit